jgi:hypothetical protein
MSTYYPNPVVTLSRSATPVSGAIVQSVGWKANDGWSFSAVVIGDALDPYEDRDTEYTVSFTDGLGNSQSTGPCYWSPREYHHEYNSEGSIDLTVITGEDAALFKMRASNQSFASYANSTSDAIIGELATRAGATITGAPEFDVTEEDVKNAKLADALNRYLEISAYEFGVNTSGQIACRSWESSGGTLSFDWSSLVHQVDPRALYTGIRYGKRSSQPYSGEQVYDFESTGFVTQELATPLLSASVANESNGTDGNVYAVTFYNADDEWTLHYDFTLGGYAEPGSTQGTGASTYFIAVVVTGTIAGATRARVRVTGSPAEEVPEGVDVEFLWPAISGDPDTSLGVWPYESDFIDQLFPSQSYAEGRAPYILSKLNAPADVLRMSGPLQCGTGVQLFCRYTYRTREYKLHEINWDFASNKTTLLLVRQTTETID